NVQVTRDSLWRITVETSAEAEEAVAQLLEELFGQPTSVYLDARMKKRFVTLYADSQALVSQSRLSLSASGTVARPEKTGNYHQAIKSAVNRGLKHIRTCGLAIGSGMISVRKIRREDWAESWKRHFRPIEIRS